MASRPAFNIRRGRVIVLIVIFLLLISLSTIVNFYTDFLWFQEVGFVSVFWKVLGAKASLSVVFGAAFFVFCLANLVIVGRIQPAYPLSISREDPLERYRAAFTPYLRVLFIGVSLFLGFLFGLGVVPFWDTFLLFQNSMPFGMDDPLFGRDLGFYVFRLPAFQYVYGWGMTALVVVTMLVGLAHLLTGGIRPQAPGDRVTPQVKAHISILIGLIALLRAWGYRLDQYELLYSERGTVIGASYTDVNAELPALKLLVVISIIAAVLFLVNIRFRGWMLPASGVALWALTAIIAAGLFPFIVQRFRVDPAELQRERPFLERNIESTRRAYGLESMEVTPYPVGTEVTREDVAGNQVSIDNIRLWDPETLTQVYRQLQEITLYYRFVDVDIDRYRLNGQPKQVLLSARELDYGNLETPTWQNEHLVFTHGYGAVVSPTHESTTAGEPQFLVSQIPPRSQVPELEIEEGGVYFGETEWLYSIVNTEQDELDFSEEDEVRTTQYAGEAGVETSGLLRRMAFAWRFRDVNLLISGLINEDSKVLFYRHIRERVQNVAPFLAFDGDPYLAIIDGRLVWIMDSYTTSSMYPYSQVTDFGSRSLMRGDTTGPAFTGRGNYIRNSVKATIDAYNGTITLYVWDEEDPIIQAWRQIFPDAFEDAEAMPEDLRAHVRFPEDLFRIQTDLYRRYHMINPASFYQNEDIWVIPRTPEAQEAGVGGEMQPYYVLMKLPGSDVEQYVLILPMNPKDRPNMVSLLAATSDPDDYGKLLDLRFPRGIQVDGVNQVFARINQDPIISETRTLLGEVGSEVIFGNLLVIPLGESILYSQPFFVKARDNPIPELKNVILASSERVVMQPTLEAALEALLTGREADIPTEDLIGGTAAEAVEEALEHFAAANEALRRGDLETYAREIEAAQDALEGAQPEGASPSPEPSPAD